MKTAILIFAVLSIPVLAFSATIYVPDNYPTIQGAIDASVNGDTVIVRDGTYEESIDFIGKAITVISESGPEYTAIIANVWGGTVNFQSGESTDSVLEGFTVHDRRASGILCDHASPTIRHNILRENTPGGGGAIFCKYASPIIDSNLICDNGAWYKIRGDGIVCSYSSPVIKNNTITGNIGAGIACYDYSSPIIENNIITMNGGYQVSIGGGILCLSSNPTIVDNYICFNSTNDSGGGIFCSNASPIITNNIICMNGGFFGGVYCEYSSSPTITNCTISNNVTLESPWAGGILCTPDAFPTLTNVIIWNNDFYQIVGNPTVSYSDVQGGWPGVGNIDADPLFADFFDFHLTFNSPCRGSGDNEAAGLPNYDFEGDPRIYQGTVDMGADEFYTHLYITGDQTPGGSIQGKFVGLPGTSPVRLFIGLGGVRPTPLPTAYGDLWLLPPRLSIPLVPIPANGILAITTTIPVMPSAPYDNPMQGLIGLNSDSITNLYVLEVR